jgi:hypothetical protein
LTAVSQGADEREPSVRAGRGAGVARPLNTGRRRAAHVVLVVLVVLCGLPLVVILTATRTVLNPAFYSQSLARAHAYDRIYTEVLPDPAVDTLLAGLPIDSSLVTANLRTVLPPATVQEMTDEQITRIVDYLRARTGDVELAVDLRPIFGNISGLANRYIAGELGNGTSYRAASVQDFTHGVLTALDDIAAGRPPASLPSIELTPQDTDRILPLVLDRVDPATRASDPNCGRCCAPVTWPGRWPWSDRRSSRATSGPPPGSRRRCTAPLSISACVCRTCGTPRRSPRSIACTTSPPS